jgi:cell wall-associated NlpC family hydrolase
VTRPTPAALAFARSTLPVKRVASPVMTKAAFAGVLQNVAMLRSATQRKTSPQASPSAAPTEVFHSAMMTAGGPTPMSRSEIQKNAQQLMGVPYVWGGTSSTGLDCSAFVSKAWGVGRLTTDNLASVSTPIGKDALQPGDALNLTTGKDSDGTGHVRLFDGWANPEHTKMSVYEETPPRSIHHVINWDPKYQPMRRNNVTDA